MMNVTLSNDKLLLDVHGLDNLWTLNSHLEIPLSHISGASIGPEVAAHPPKDRAGLIHLPEVAKIGTVGTFIQNGQRSFWDVRDPDKAIAITLQQEHYAQLVIEVADPQTLMAQIERMLERRMQI